METKPMEPRLPSHRALLGAGAALIATAFACGFVDPSGGSKPLAIQRFIAVPPAVAAGSPTVLSWDVEGAESIEVDNGVGLVQPTGSRTVHPEATTTYRLLAVAGTSLATASIRVVVTLGGPAPSPSPSSSPSPSASGTPRPSPTPSASPSPSPSPDR
jgi:hypothetical protein